MLLTLLQKWWFKHGLNRPIVTGVSKFIQNNLKRFETFYQVHHCNLFTDENTVSICENIVDNFSIAGCRQLWAYSTAH